MVFKPKLQYICKTTVINYCTEWGGSAYFIITVSLTLILPDIPEGNIQGRHTNYMHTYNISVIVYVKDLAYLLQQLLICSAIWYNIDSELFYNNSQSQRILQQQYNRLNTIILIYIYIYLSIYLSIYTYIYIYILLTITTSFEKPYQLICTPNSN